VLPASVLSLAHMEATPCLPCLQANGAAGVSVQAWASQSLTVFELVQTLEEMQAKVADREVTAARLQDEQRKAALLAQVPAFCHVRVLAV